MSAQERIDDFLADGPWAVAGASNDRAKYGNKVLRCYLQVGRAPVYPVNPGAAEVEGVPCYADVGSTPEPVRALSIITPPPVTEEVVAQAIDAGVRHVWMQPGAENEAAVEACERNGLGVIAGGPCLLVVLGYRE